MVVQKVKHFTTKLVVKKFADKLHFVYFGHVGLQDDHTMVLGATASTSHEDNFYTVGYFEGHDVILLQRTNTLHFPGKATVNYKWLIFQFDLKQSNLPHIFIDNQHHDETFFANLAVGFTKLKDMSGAFTDVGATVLIDPVRYPAARMLLSPAIVNTLTQNFRHLDVEINDDQLFIYAKDTHINMRLLENILKLGSWMAAQLDSTKLPE
ncbi:MAG TPA: hypothetical protein VLA77_03480 [Candidatus Saccharimonadales bacterium]|nr:hypothetical protein [Candidatus Saccharimonadales bacterium]